MATTRLTSFLHLHEIFAERYMAASPHVFRGICNKDHKLIPKVGRYKRYSLRFEREILYQFKRYAHPFLEYKLENDWEWLATAQYHGLPTRLLDWSSNPLVAAFFATEGDVKTDSAIYALNAYWIVDPRYTRSPFKASEIQIFQPANITKRIAAQGGHFTVHPKPTEPLDRRTLHKYIVPNELRREFQIALYNYGIHRGTLFPDLDGQAKMIEWQAKSSTGSISDLKRTVVGF
jgi:hypothetical protein